SGGDAGGVGGGDARGHAWPGRDAVRSRWVLLVADGRRDRLDDRGDGVGRRTARRHRPDGGVRDRSFDRSHRRDHPARAVTNAAALSGAAVLALSVIWAL